MMATQRGLKSMHYKRLSINIVLLALFESWKTESRMVTAFNIFYIAGIFSWPKLKMLQEITILCLPRYIVESDV